MLVCIYFSKKLLNGLMNVYQRVFSFFIIIYYVSCLFLMHFKIPNLMPVSLIRFLWPSVFSGLFCSFKMLSRGRKFGNDTIDVANKGCWEPYDTLACLRTGLLTIASTITLIFIILKIVKYHVFRNTRMHHYAIFYTSAIECIVW